MGKAKSKRQKTIRNGKKGRPRVVISQDDLDRLETMSGLGMNLPDMAAVLGISLASLNRLIAGSKKISETIERGRGKAAYSVTKTAFQLATNGQVPAMTMFWLKCQKRWKEVQHHEVTGVEGQALTFIDLAKIAGKNDISE